MSTLKNLIIIRAGKTTKKGMVTRWAKVPLRQIARIMHDCIPIGNTLVVSGPDKAGVMSSKIIREELERLLILDGISPVFARVPSEENELLGVKFNISEDGDMEEDHATRLFLAKQIIDFIKNAHTERLFDTLILVTHAYQSVIIEDKYASSVLGNDSRHPYGGVSPGSAIWTHKYGTTPMTIPLHDKLQRLERLNETLRC
ncbi:MAG: hypothetical protein HZA94_01895 [Candidatus Vogelbacteria bacterium]|nr:hypothetical protein [Candidatus Vogelbacteria bacterium]